MLVIRLTRRGKKNQPFFRIVVIDKRRSAKGGKAVEILGYLNPLTKKKSLNKERILYWLKNGAQPSATIHNLLISEKIIEGKKIHVARVKTKPPSEAAASATGGSKEAPAQPQVAASSEKVEKEPAKAEVPNNPAESLPKTSEKPVENLIQADNESKPEKTAQ